MKYIVMECHVSYAVVLDEDVREREREVENLLFILSLEHDADQRLRARCTDEHAAVVG